MTSVIGNGINCVSALTAVLLYLLRVTGFCSWHTLLLMLGSQCCQALVPASAPSSGQGQGHGHLPRHKRSPRTRSSPLKSVAALVCSVLVFHALAVLFGAPVRGSSAETLQLSCLLSVLVVLPGCLKSGLEGPLSLLRMDCPDDELKNSALATLGGAWCGGVVIPLDWDRPWQRWPLPCFGGALAGFFLFHAFEVARRSGVLPFERAKVKEGVKL